MITKERRDELLARWAHEYRDGRAWRRDLTEAERDMVLLWDVLLAERLGARRK